MTNTEKYNHIPGLAGPRITRVALALLHDRYPEVRQLETCEYRRPTVRLSPEVEAALERGRARAREIKWAQRSLITWAQWQREQHSVWALEQAAADGRWENFLKKTWEPYCLRLQYQNRARNL